MIYLHFHPIQFTFSRTKSQDDIILVLIKKKLRNIYRRNVKMLKIGFLKFYLAEF